MDPETTENLNGEWSTQATSQTRRLKVLLPQCYAALAILAVNWSHAYFESSVIVAVLLKEIGSASHTTCISMTCIGLLVGGMVAHFTGARVVVMLAGVVSIVGWTTFLGWTPSTTVLQWIIYVAALAKGMLQGPSYVYLAEISQPNMRTAVMAAMCLTAKDNLVDVYYMVLLSRPSEGPWKILVDIISSFYFNLTSYEPTKIAVFANIGLAVFGAVAMFHLPDSPYWLANKGRYHAVESSLAWFRGRTTVENVKTESKAIIGNAQNGPSAWKLFGHKSLYIAAFVVGYVFLSNAFVKFVYEAYLFQPKFVLRVLAKFSDPILAWAISSVFITIAFVALVAIIGKKVMILISWFCAILIAFTARYLSKSEVLSADTYSWFLQCCLAIAYFCLIAGVISIPMMLNGEIFPSKLRNLGAGFGLFVAYLMKVASIDLYLKYMPFADGVRGHLALASIAGFVLVLWVFPRNEKKSLVEIERS